jgi:hypothetical protein
MHPVRAVGMAIYTYAELEKRLNSIWEWLQALELWLGHGYAEYGFVMRGKESARIWKATPTNRARLYERLQNEQPWYLLNLGWPAGTLHTFPSLTKGMSVALKSEPPPKRRMERYRTPSYLSVILHPDVFTLSNTGMEGLLKLGQQAWQLCDGAYGFIDVETGIPLHDHLLRNIDHLHGSLVPPEYDQEFRKWQDIMPNLNQRVWKAYWGNFLCQEHLQRLGGVQEMRRADPRYRLLPEYLETSWRQGRERLQACACFHELRDLANGGVLLTLSASPLDWFDAMVQNRRVQLQDVLGHLALGPWDDDTLPLDTGQVSVSLS